MSASEHHAPDSEASEPASGWAGPASEPGHFRPDIEGLRAVAVVAVLLFHVGVPGFAGGFTGVDVFYVISGFLITGLLIREVDSTGTIRLATFYARRLRRLLPAALIVILATLALSTLALSTIKFQHVAGDAVAAALYVANYRFALDSIDYLADTVASPLLHYWSLAVEEQFYLFWPFLVLLTVRLLSRRWLGLVVGLVAVASFGIALVLTDIAQPVSFFSLPSRAWELAIGALLAIWLGRSEPRLPKLALQGAGVVGLALIVGSAVLIDPRLPYPSFTALAPTLGAAMVIVAGHASGGVGALLASAVPRYLGRISYSLYLWHWPIITLVPQLLGRDDLLTRVALAVVSIGVAAASTRWIEERFRLSGKRGAGLARVSSGGTIAIAAGSSVGVAAVALATAWTGMMLLPSSFTGHPTGPLPTASQTVLAKPVVSGALPSDLRPSVLGSQDDLPDAYRDGCLRGALVSTASPCFYGDDAGTTVVLFGDSKVVQWLPAFQRLAEDSDLRIVLLAKGACTPAEVGIWNDKLRRPSRECATWRESAVAEIEKLHPDVVVMSSSPYYTIANGDSAATVKEAPEVWRHGLASALERAGESATDVILLASSPRLPMSPSECLASNSDLAACEVSASEAVVDLYQGLESEAAAQSGARYVTLNDDLCGATCPLVFDHFNVYRDVSHLTATFATILADTLGRDLGLAEEPVE